MNAIQKDRTVTVALVGNPNSGKTTLSNQITGSRDSVGNYPRVTVARKQRSLRHAGWTITLVDLPGAYSLTSRTPDEKVTRDTLQDQRPDIVINVIDAGNLTRSLFLTTQIIEMGLPRIHVLNMMDEAERRGMAFDLDVLSKLLGGPVVPMVARRGRGGDALLDAIVDVAGREITAMPGRIAYDSHLDAAIGQVESHIAELHPDMLERTRSRWLAIKLLEGDDEILRREDDHQGLMIQVAEARAGLERTHGESVETMLADARYGFAHGVVLEATRRPGRLDSRIALSSRLDGLLLNRVLGLPLFLFFLWLMFEATFTLGAYPMDWIDAGAGWVGERVAAAMPEGLVRGLVVDGVIAGMGGTIIFLPNIVILFFFMAVLSETGYLARSAFLLDRVMHAFGLHGKAFIPLVMGFGCNVPAILATRTIESERTRLLSILVNPFITCSARLPVFILFAGAFFAEWAGTVVFLMYVFSIVVAMGAAVLLGRTVVRGGAEPFVMELPPYRLPTLGSILFHMWEKAWGFIKKVTGVILVGSILIWFLQAFPRDLPRVDAFDDRLAALDAAPPGPDRDAEMARLANERARLRMAESYLGRVAGAAQPALAPLGLGWMDTVAILTGFVAKEVVVASYAVMFAQGAETTEEDTTLRDALAGSMTPPVALGFMTFILLYTPCLSTVAVIRRETESWRWTAFSVLFSLTVAYAMALAVVNIARVVL